MKLAPLSALSLIAVGLLSGCGVGVQASTLPAPQAATPEPAVTSTPGPSEEAIPPEQQPIVVDLTRQYMSIPGTEYGQVDVPILAGNEAGAAGPSVITPEPAGVLPYTHCEDWTVAWGGAGSRSIQIVTYDHECADSASFHGRSVIVVPRVVTEHDGMYGTVDRWLTEGREIVFTGESPHGNLTKGGPEEGFVWPDDRHTFLGSVELDNPEDSGEEVKPAVRGPHTPN